MTVIATFAPLPVAISGCGAVTELYYGPTLRALERTGRIETVALFDPDRDRRDLIAAAFPTAARCSTLATVFETRPRLLIVASPPRFHAEQTISALSAGIDVLCEKPVAVSSMDARAMAAKASAAGRLLAVAMVRRQMPAARMIRTLLGAKLLGAIAGFEVFEGGSFHWPVHAGDYFDPHKSGGGVLLDVGAHVLDLLVWWLGAPSEIVAEDDAMGGIEANARVNLRCGGVPGVVRLSRDWQRPNHVTLWGAKGSLHWNPEYVDRVTLALAGQNPLEIRAPTGAPATFLECFHAQLTAVLDALAGKPADIVDANELLASIEVIETAYRERSLMTMPWLSAHERSAALRARSSGARP